MNDWSIVTVTHNSADAIREFWPQDGIQSNIDWIVVDNNSSDESVSEALKRGATVLKNSENVGFGAANNLGFRSSKSKYVLFANPDLRIDMRSLHLLETHLAEEPRDLVSAQLLFPDGTPQPNGRGAARLFYKILNRVRPQAVENKYTFVVDDGEQMVVDWFIGACVAGTRSRLEELGPWDPKFFVYYEDSDLGMRNHRSGGASVVIGSARWVHGWARQTSSANLKAWRLELSSMMRFYARYPRLLLPPMRREVRGPDAVS